MYPKDNIQRKIGTRARAILFYKINSEHWDFKEESGNDVGRDCIIEFSDNDEWKNDKIECQIKGTEHIDRYCRREYISFPIDVKTINYAKNSNISFVIFLIDVVDEIVYYLCVQDYLKMNSIDDKLNGGQKTINIIFPITSTLFADDIKLIELAKKNQL